MSTPATVTLRMTREQFDKLATTMSRHYPTTADWLHATVVIDRDAAIGGPPVDRQGNTMAAEAHRALDGSEVSVVKEGDRFAMSIMGDVLCTVTSEVETRWPGIVEAMRQAALLRVRAAQAAGKKPK